MPKKRIPEFETEDEELSFWNKHDLQQFQCEPADDILLAVKPERKKAVTLRLEPSVIERLKSIAKRENVPYQALMRTLVKVGLKRLERAS